LILQELQKLQFYEKKKHGSPLSGIGEPIVAASLIALASASFWFADPALAFKVFVFLSQSHYLIF